MDITRTIASSLGCARVTALLLMCGCENRALTDQHPIQQQSQVEAPSMSVEEQAKADLLFKQLTARLDQAIADSSPLTAWTPPADVEAELQRAASDAQIDKIGCAGEFCRYVVTVKSESEKQAFPGQLLIHGAVIFDYPLEHPLSIVAYVFRPGADMHSL